MCIWQKSLALKSCYTFMKSVKGHPRAMFRHGHYSLDKRPVGGWSSGQYTTCCRYCRCIVLTIRKHDVYMISHPRKAPVRGLGRGTTFKTVCSYAPISRGGRRLPAGVYKEASSFSRGIFVPIVLVNASREGPIVTCRTLDGCNRLTSIFLSMPRHPLPLFLLAFKAVIMTLGSYKRNIAYDVTYVELNTSLFFSFDV